MYGCRNRIFVEFIVNEVDVNVGMLPINYDENGKLVQIMAWNGENSPNVNIDEIIFEYADGSTSSPVYNVPFDKGNGNWWYQINLDSMGISRDNVKNITLKISGDVQGSEDKLKLRIKENSGSDNITWQKDFTVGDFEQSEVPPQKYYKLWDDASSSSNGKVQATVPGTDVIVEASAQSAKEDKVLEIVT